MSECCNHNCNEGRSCPERTRRIQENDYRWRIGVEAADAARVTGSPPIVTAELREVPSFWQRIGFACVVALCLLWAAIAVWG